MVSEPLAVRLGSACQTVTILARATGVGAKTPRSRALPP